MNTTRVRYLEHAGKKILLTDLNDLDEGDVLSTIVSATKVIRSHEERSVLTLTDARTARFSLRNERGEYDRVAADTIRKSLVGNAPYVRASAIVLGRDDSKHVIAEFFTRVSDRHFEVFDSVEAALDWLVEQ